MPDSITAQLVPVLSALAAKGVILAEQEDMTPEQYALVCTAAAALFKAARPVNLSALNITEQVNHTGEQFVLNGVTGKPVLVSVEGAILPQNRWGWSAESTALTLLEGYRFPNGAEAIELYILWSGDEELVSPPTS